MSAVGTVKLTGKYGQRIEQEARERQVSKAALLTDYAMRGIEAADRNEGTALDGFERRIAATMLAVVPKPTHFLEDRKSGSELFPYPVSCTHERRQ